MLSAKKAEAVRQEIQRLQKEVQDLRARRHEILTGASSASLSAGSGSKSYTNWDPAKIDAAIAKDLRDIAKLKRALDGRPAYRLGFAQIGRC